ncbi:hypothetical protein [Chitinibacter tainanensis]|uniref:hypothetical protein n=1 Tax=Chitinibacter tainanensis TaxID=230667 RepID=UPI0012EBC222|nr:hypothetical protein [Chitinibacter tainanensis]
MLTTLLTACGGGGGTGASTNTGTSTSTSTPAPLVTPAPTVDPSQTTATATVAAQAYLNAARNECGFGAITTSSALNSAVVDANNYYLNRVAENDLSYVHTQTVGKTGFTGVTPAQRASYRGYPNANSAGGMTATPRVAETLTTQGLPAGYTFQSLNTAGQAMAQSLLNTVYHLGANMLPLSDVGTSFVKATTADGSEQFRLTFLQGDLTFVDAGKVGQDRARTYPCQGSKVPNEFRPNQEVPNPAPDVGARVVGTPILIQVPQGVTPSIISATIKNTRTGQFVPVRRIQNGCTNPIPGDLTGCYQGESSFDAAQAFLLPMDPLEANTVHEVVINLNTLPQIAFSFTPIGALNPVLVKK